MTRSGLFPFCLTTLQHNSIGFLPFQVLGFIPRTEEKALSLQPKIKKKKKKDETTKLTATTLSAREYGPTDIQPTRNLKPRVRSF
jgi:hypothetical protein